MTNGAISRTPSGHNGLEWHLAAVADFNGDQNSELLWLNNNGAADLWQINGSQVSTRPVPTPTGEILTF